MATEGDIGDTPYNPTRHGIFRCVLLRPYATGDERETPARGAAQKSQQNCKDLTDRIDLGLKKDYYYGAQKEQKGRL